MTDHKATIYEFFAAINNEGLDAVPRFVTSDFVWWAAGPGEIQNHLVDMGEVVKKYFDGSIKMTVHDVIVEGNRGAAEAESFGRLKNGSIYNNLYHFKFFFENGKIKKINEYNDTRHAEETVGDVFSDRARRVNETATRIRHDGPSAK